MKNYKPNICVFCGARVGRDVQFQKEAEAFAHELVKRDWGLVFGGGNVGLMGIIANETLKIGGRVIGVIPEDMVVKELAHQGLTELRVVKSMHERKATMAELSHGVVALPGGFGTLDELCEIITWQQLGYIYKPIALLNTGNYFDHFLSFTEHAIKSGFIERTVPPLYDVSKNLEELFDYFESSFKANN